MTKGSKFDDFLKDENIEIDEEKIKENIEQMTDKEIIIDGVDVSECEFYTTMEDCVGIHDLCEQLDDYCSIKKDCYYKQLKQLEQENAELKAENKELAHYLACMTEQRNKANTCLQEIKAIAEMDCGDCQYNQDCDCNFEECEEAKVDDILDLITKAESEG